MRCCESDFLCLYLFFRMNIYSTKKKNESTNGCRSLIDSIGQKICRRQTSNSSCWSRKLDPLFPLSPIALLKQADTRRRRSRSGTL